MSPPRRAREAAPIGQLDTGLLAVRARAEILQAIMDGRLEGKLPNEDRLAELLNVSRTTVRTALQALERDGIITRRRAIGTIINSHVRPSSLALQRLTGFDWLLAERGRQVEVEASWRWGVAGEDFARAFGVEADLECCLIDKKYAANGANALTIVDAVPRDSLLEGHPQGEIESSLFAFSDAHCRAPIHHAVVEIVPKVKRECETRLEIDEGAPYIRLHETHYTADSDPAAYSLIDVNDSVIRLEVVRTQ